MTKSPSEAGVSVIHDHDFVPRAEWYSLCKICGLAEAAHVQTIVKSKSEDKK